MPGDTRAEIVPGDTLSLQWLAAADHSCDADGHYSIMRTPRQDCAAHGNSAAARNAVDPRDWEPLNLNILQAEIYAFAVIGIAQVRGGPQLLGDLWYAGAVLVPPFMEKHPEYGMTLNYAAITPPFIALGLMNGYLHRVDAVEPRIFLSNFIGFNLGLLWSHAMLDRPQRKAREASSPNARRVESYLFPTPAGDGAGVLMSLRW